MSTTNQVVVIGAGISGLCVAHWLSRAGIRVTVLEGERWVGGTMRTIRDHGWMVETGPNSALETTPLFSELFDDLGIGGRRVYANEASDRRYIVRNGELHPLPMSPLDFIRTPLWSWHGKLRLGGELFIGRGKKEESIAEFVTRRLGTEFLDYAVNPFIAGVYAGNPADLSVRSALPKLYALEESYGGLIRGMIAGAGERRRRAETAKVRARMFSFDGGMQVLPLAIAARLGRKVRPGERVLALETPIRGKGSRFRIVHGAGSRRTSVRADVVILSTPAYGAAPLLKQLAPALSDTLEGIFYPPVTQVFLGYREDQLDRALDGFGFLVPEVEQHSILGTIWSSALFPGRAPAGHVAFTSFVGGGRQPHLAALSGAELQALVTDELRSLLGVLGAPVYSRLTRWEKSIPQYTVGYHRVLEEIERVEKNLPGIFFCGNYRGGISVGDCVISARRIADRAAQILS